MHRSTTAIITTTEITRTGNFYKCTCSDRSIDLCVLRDACHELIFYIFGDFYASGTQDAELTKSLIILKIFFTDFFAPISRTTRTSCLLQEQKYER